MSLSATEIDEILRSFEVFRAGAPERARRFLSSGLRMRLAPGEHALEEGDDSAHVFGLVKGTVGVFYSDAAGGNVLVKIFGPPALFGEMELPFSLPRMEYVEVFDESELVRWDGPEFLSYLRSDGGSAYAMFCDVAARLCISAYLERALAFQDIETRTAGLFLSFLDATASSRTIPFRVTYPMIARCLGATEKSVERTIGRWLQEGWLKRTQGRYEIADLQALRGKADPDLLSLHARLGRGPRRSIPPPPRR